MLGPIHARGDQLNGRRIDQVNRPLEFTRKAPRGSAADKRRRDLAQIFIHRPEELSGQDRISHRLACENIDGKLVVRSLAARAGSVTGAALLGHPPKLQWTHTDIGLRTSSVGQKLD